MNDSFFVVIVGFGQWLVIAAGVAGLAYVLRRHGARRVWWFAGAGAFVASQLVRLPLLTLVGAFAPGAALAAALASSGIFEEGARYFVMRRLARDVRDRASAVMFGAGHGGIEALLIFSMALLNTVVLSSNGEAIAAQLPTAQAEALRAQIAGLYETPLWMYALGIWERVPALMVHIAASVLVMRAVRDGAVRFLLAAIALHIAVNTLAVLSLPALGPLATEALITAAGVVSLWISRRVEPPAIS